MSNDKAFSFIGACIRIFAILACVCPAGFAAHATDVKVDLELALGIDVSGSVDDEEAVLQRNGYIAAFRHPSVVDAIQHGGLGRIAVSYYEWAGFGHMKIIAPWTLIRDEATADAFSALLTREPPETARRTAIAAAISFGADYFDNNGFAGRRRVLDISGDGPNNWGDRVDGARDRAVARGITINGLPIVNDRPSFSGRPPMKNLDLYYRDCVIGGPGAFYVVAKDFKDFARAVLRKLILEIAGRRPAPRQQRAIARHSNKLLIHIAGRPASPKRVAPPCDAGERMRWRWFNDDDDLLIPRRNGEMQRGRR
jgi:hypothetical protein